MAKTDLYLDTEHECIVIRRIDDAGDVIEDYPEVIIKLADMQYATQPDEFPIQAIFRRVHFTDAQDASKKRCYGLFTMPEDDSTDDGYSSDTDDLYLGGGGGLQKFIFHEFFGAALLCWPTEDGVNPTEGSALTWVAQPFKLRAVGSAVIPTGEGTNDTVTYSAYDWSIQKRTATIAGQSIFELITPRYLVGDLIVAASVPNNGGASELLDLNVDGRAWAKAYNQS